MNARTTSPAGQSAIDPELHPPTEELAKPAEPATVEASPSGGTPAGAELPAGMEPPPPQPRPPGFRERGRMRRRVRFLRKVRELAYRDLGGLVFEMQRLSQRNDELLAAKLGVLANFDTELRALEAALDERRPVTVLREAGIAACPRCAAIHSSDDRFCPMCGMPMVRQAESPIAATPPMPASAPTVSGAGVHPSGAVPPPLAAAAVAAASTITPGQLPLSATTAPPVNPPATASVQPPVNPPAAPPTPPPPAQEDRPTEIIRPRDEAR